MILFSDVNDWWLEAEEEYGSTACFDSLSNLMLLKSRLEKRWQCLVDQQDRQKREAWVQSSEDILMRNAIEHFTEWLQESLGNVVFQGRVFPQIVDKSALTLFENTAGHQANTVGTCRHHGWYLCRGWHHDRSKHSIDVFFQTTCRHQMLGRWITHEKGHLLVQLSIFSNFVVLTWKNSNVFEETKSRPWSSHPPVDIEWWFDPSNEYVQQRIWTENASLRQSLLLDYQDNLSVDLLNEEESVVQSFFRTHHVHRRHLWTIDSALRILSHHISG